MCCSVAKFLIRKPLYELQNFQLLTLDSLAFYWNASTKKKDLLSSQDDWVDQMKEIIHDQTLLDHILRPLSLTARMELDQDARVLQEKPKVIVLHVFYFIRNLILEMRL